MLTLLRNSNCPRLIPHLALLCYNCTLNVLSTQFSAPPTPKAKGNMNATIYSAVFIPRSFTIMKKFAMHGTNSVITVRLTTIWIGSSNPSLASMKSPAAP